MVQQIMAARAVSVLLAKLGEEADGLRGEVRQRLNDPPGQSGRQGLGEIAGAEQDGAGRRATAYACLRLLSLSAATQAALDRMRVGAAGPTGPSLPIFRAPEETARAGLRTFLAVLLAAAALSVAGWPEASLGLTFIGATLGIGGTNAKLQPFALAAMVAMPLAVLLPGTTEFFVLDGADGFPTLAAALAPPVIGASILLKRGNPKLVGLGFLIIVFFPVLLSPSNPQSYDPQSFLNTSVLAITAVVGAFMLLSTLLPITDAMRRTWILRSVRAESARAPQGWPNSRMPRDSASAAFRDATRMAQLRALSSADEGSVAVEEPMCLINLSAMRHTILALGLTDDAVNVLLLAAAEGR